MTARGGTTTVELIEQLLERAKERRAEAIERQRPEATREFGLAITALEDAQMRYTRGVAHMEGLFAPRDLEAPGS